MSTSTYLIDSALVLLVLLQLRERPLTNRALLRPLIILAIAVASYLTAVPTAGNDLILIVALAVLGTTLGLLSGVTVRMRRTRDGAVTAQARTASAAFWVLGMGSRFAFAVWAASAAGETRLGHFSAAHAITGAAAWTDALLFMAIGEVVARTGLLALRRHRLSTAPALVAAA